MNFSAGGSVGALADVQRGGGDEAWDDAGAQRGVVFAERIFHGDAGAAAEGVGQLRIGDEAERLRFKAAAIDQGLTDGHGEVVSAIRGIAGHGDGGHFRRNAVETDHTGDFLDEIDGALQIGAVAGDVPAALMLRGGFFAEAELFEDGVDFVAGEIGRAEELAGAVFVECDLAGQSGRFACDVQDVPYAKLRERLLADGAKLSGDAAPPKAGGKADDNPKPVKLDAVRSPVKADRP